MKLKYAILLGAVSLSTGCAVKPVALTTDELRASIRTDVDRLSQQRDAISEAIGLDEAIARAVRNNRDRKLKVLESALAQKQIELARHDLLPSLTAAAGYSERNNYAASASVQFADGNPEPLPADPSYSVSQDKRRSTYDVAFTWNVLDFGLSYVRANQQADRFLIGKERERKVVHNITQEVRAAYWRAVSAERLLQKIGPLIERAEAALNDSRKVEAQQLRPPLEALQYQRELLEILRSLQSLRQDLMNARTELASLMGLRPGTSF
ncbi:MAG: TolC family protein, partial [Hydrogenophaga sp.]|nr:TolC family protein [Hydrogenophaga sp.]